MKLSYLLLLVPIGLAPHCSKKITPVQQPPVFKNDTVDKITIMPYRYPQWDTTNNFLSLYVFDEYTDKVEPNGRRYNSIAVLGYNDTLVGNYYVKCLWPRLVLRPTQITGRAGEYTEFTVTNDSVNGRPFYEVYDNYNVLIKRVVANCDTLRVAFLYDYSDLNPVHPSNEGVTAATNFYLKENNEKTLLIRYY